MVATSSVLAVLALTPAPATAADTCPNAAFRAGYGAYLPDCRAYEQVSPVDKNDFDIAPLTQAVAPSGGAITYPSQGAFAGNPSASLLDQYLSTRSSSGWSTQGVTPPFTNAGQSVNSSAFGFSADLSRIVAFNAGTPVDDLYRRNPDGSFDLVTPGSTDTSQNFPEFLGANADYSQVVFETFENLTPDSQTLPSGFFDTKIYEWANGQLSLVSILPDGTPSLGHGRSAGIDRPAVPNAISADGSRVYWQSGGDSGGSPDAPVYLREGGATVLVSERQSDGTPQPATLLAATPDGSAAFFTSAAQLTGDASPAGADLYRYDAQAGQLTDLTSDSTDAGGAAVQGLVGASDDGAYVYFVANGVLATNVNSEGDTAAVGGNNIYLRHGATTTFIATLAPGTDQHTDADNWLGSIFATPWRKSTRSQVTPDGQHLLFTTQAQLTAYDNAGNREVYSYDAASGNLNCVSCDPSGAPATTDAVLSRYTNEVAACCNLGNFNSNELSPVHNASPDARRIFFETLASLSPADTNGQEDVYEWEAAGVGSCASSADNGGCLHLISTGRSGFGSLFEGASDSGDNAFILTRSSLVGQDTDALYDVYDARVDGGFASQNPPPSPPPCSGDGCQGPAGVSPAPPLAASVSFFGSGNAKAPARARVLTRVVHGASFLVKVSVPANGRITISGAGITTVRRPVSRLGTYRLRVRLTAGEKRRLGRRHHLRLRLRVAYAPSVGAGSSAVVTLTVKPAGRHLARHARRAHRAAGSDGGGAR